MSQTTFFKVDRKILNHPLWLAEPFTKGQAWIDLIGEANHAPGYFLKRGIKIILNRGQIGRSIECWMRRWKWSKGKVSRFFNFLEKEEMIEQQRGNQTTVITICNYKLYQGEYKKEYSKDDKANRPANSNPNGLQTVTQTDCKQDTNNKKKNKKNKKNNSFIETSIEFQLSKLLLDLMIKNSPTCRKPNNLQGWAKQIGLMINRDKRDPEQIRQVIGWCQEDEFWKTNILSTSKLRDKYDQLILKMGLTEEQPTEDSPITRQLLDSVEYKMPKSWL